MANQTRHYMTFTTLHYEVHYVCHKYQDGMDCELVKSLFCVTVTLSSLHSNHLIALPAHLHHEALPSDAIALDSLLDDCCCYIVSNSTIKL